MTRNNQVFSRRGHRGRRGQSLIFVTLWSAVAFGMAALVLDFGSIYYELAELNASTQAAAMAGAWAMSQPGATLTTVTTAATTYGGATGGKNSYGNLTGVTMATGYPALSCRSTLTTVFGIQCWGPSNSNSVAVKQHISVPLFFLRLFGGSTIDLSATATAAIRGAAPAPYNVAVIVDSTRSMGDTDSDSNCNSTRFNCAVGGVQVLLKNLSPCFMTESSCGSATNGMVANSVDRVSLLTFPPVSTASVANDYNCGTNTPATAPYTTPFPATLTYQVVGFSSDYRISDTATSLNSNSNIVAAIGGKTGSPCMQAIGGFGTYYAQVITAAQAYLVAEQKLYPNSQNVMILLSDGDANATCTTSIGGICTIGQLVGASTTSGTYMSTVNQCHQAITAAQAAATAGTRVYAVAYGAEASGCATDTPAITPCDTMQEIASSSNYFFSDYTATGGSSSCISAAQPVTGLNQIFQAVASDLGVVKLIPNNTT